MNILQNHRADICITASKIFLLKGRRKVFFMFKFDPLVLVSGGTFQILGVIFYIMYIIVTSDVNKNATFDKCRKHNIPAKLLPLRFSMLNTKYFLLIIPVENILISVFWID